MTKVIAEYSQYAANAAKGYSDGQQHPKQDINAVTPEDVTDLLADLRHLADTCGWEWQELLEKALRHYGHERLHEADHIEVELFADEYTMEDSFSMNIDNNTMLCLSCIEDVLQVLEDEEIGEERVVWLGESLQCLEVYNTYEENEKGTYG